MAALLTYEEDQTNDPVEDLLPQMIADSMAHVSAILSSPSTLHMPTCLTM